MAKLKLASTGDLAQLDRWSLLLYGDNRSGKTHFSGTWPLPIFFVPEASLSEMRTLSDQNFTVVPFGDMANCESQFNEVMKLISKGKPVGDYIPMTFVFDNLTTAQMMWEEDVKKATGKIKLEWSDWGVMKTLIVRMMLGLQKSSLHNVWITHAKVAKAQRTGPGGKIVSEDIGTFTIVGDAKNVVPNACDLLLYCEAIDRGVKGPGWQIHIRKHGIWPAGLRVTRIHKDKPITKPLGPDPHYDDLAPVLGLPLLADAEGRTDAAEAG
jgi:hypothetical protein